MLCTQCADAPRWMKGKGEGQGYDRSPRRPNWNPNTVVVDDPGPACEGEPGTCAVGVDGPLADPRGGVELRLTVACAAAVIPCMLPNCGAIGLPNGDAGFEPVARPRSRCTINGGTLCEPDWDAPRRCEGRVGDEGPALGRGGCGGR